MEPQTSLCLVHRDPFPAWTSTVTTGLELTDGAAWLISRVALEKDVAYWCSVVKKRSHNLRQISRFRHLNAAKFLTVEDNQVINPMFKCSPFASNPTYLTKLRNLATLYLSLTTHGYDSKVFTRRRANTIFESRFSSRFSFLHDTEICAVRPGNITWDPISVIECECKR